MIVSVVTCLSFMPVVCTCAPGFEFSAVTEGQVSSVHVSKRQSCQRKRHFPIPTRKALQKAGDWKWIRVQVLAIFAAAPELCGLIREVEADYERFLQHPGRRPKGPYAEILPFLAEQAQDWESSATASSSASAGPTVSRLFILYMHFAAAYV